MGITPYQWKTTRRAQRRLIGADLKAGRIVGDDLAVAYQDQHRSRKALFLNIGLQSQTMPATNMVTWNLDRSF